MTLPSSLSDSDLYRKLLAGREYDLLEDDFSELLSDTDTDNANIITRLTVIAAKRAVYSGVARPAPDVELGLKFAEIAERLGRTALYVATVQRPTKIDDSGQSDDPNGPDDPSPDPSVRPSYKA